MNDDVQTQTSDFLIFCFHGKGGKFVLPKLSSEIYEIDEPRGDIDFKHIAEFAKLNGQNIITTGCTLGHKKMADSFLKANAKTFIGAKKYPEGTSVLFFLTSLFYYLVQNEKYIDAFEKAQSIDQETKLFKLYTKNE